ncbi:MAG TPA: biotin synthase BioB [Syntrophorhabdaceae bacterium]|jgi:biotin synthase|nr:biotin synthase BioB [Syntrophorhabdaceae bacterium]HNZ59698.1 biotin synthase BioB [Syntrophorhabdaceae bacterium]HOB69999.1 biotin synthase BioB [Syntrophorhabdaceae bacterium]HOF58714.1 biotin synthase BioB [Syntrophorhabdaceae bacterium]HOS06305.1 biotin synthase BioB [Syntrophorhabdaceae bacterium]
MEFELQTITEKTIREKTVNLKEALELYDLGKSKPFLLMAYASEVRDYFKGKNISLCSIVNAKSGLCPENCKFCAQSAHYVTRAEVYPLMTKENILERAKEAKESGVGMFSIVTSGTRIEGEDEWKEIEEAIVGMVALGIKPCASIGMLDSERAKRLKDVGLFRYHHNLETARSNFDNICSTHDYDDDIETVKNAKNAGLSVCSGGIIGLGETMEQRIEMAYTLKELDVDSVPINILNPIDGTPMSSAEPLSPLEILITIALYRFILPDKDIKLCGGKEKNLRQLLPFAIEAGCNSLMTGNYLTTLGRNAAKDIEMIIDLGYTVDMKNQIKP